MAKTQHTLGSTTATTRPDLPPGGPGGMEHGGGKGQGGGAPNPANMGDVFSFTIASGAVTAGSFTTPAGKTVTLPTVPSVSYNLAGSDVLATHTGANFTETLRYSDTDADGLYQVIASSRVLMAAPQTDALGFVHAHTLAITTSGATVTGVTAVRGDDSKVLFSNSVAAPANTTWALNNGLLVETHAAATTGGVARYEVFRDGNGDGIYTEVASGTGAMIDLTGVVSATQAFAATL